MMSGKAGLSVIGAFAAFAGLGPALAGQGDGIGARGAAKAVAVAKFDYKDTSGEIRDQSAEHEARLSAFRAGIEAGLTAGDEALSVVSLDCVDRSACSLGTLRPQRLLALAKDAGANYLVFGEIHKMSTLVGFGRIDVLDVARDQLVFERTISFRGDSDEAFRRAAEFVVRDILRSLNETGAIAQSAGPGREPARP
ncbi:DUF2380 domain-containing protein [Jiella mangrovi]|uniref:DUF2380 domain-containing protein n=1 Tax=Jiella mangrovi TaxID=2821407 RepID=A0ABS4BI22_9HYPH|nr:DUF2380 domain-containing protein [Jiella mangrovi]MBP0616336.1 DUF2380 domain-containing protein [Jiella mangrovi]